MSISGTITRIDLRRKGRRRAGSRPASADLELSADGGRLFVANSNSERSRWSTRPPGRCRKRSTCGPMTICPSAASPTPWPEPRWPHAVCRQRRQQRRGGGQTVRQRPGQPAKSADLFPPAGFPAASAPTASRSLHCQRQGRRLAQPDAKKATKAKGDKVRVAEQADEQERANGKEWQHCEAHCRGWNSHAVRGSISRVEMPDDAQLAALHRAGMADARVPQTLRALEAAQSGVRPCPCRAAGRAVGDRARRLRDQGEPHLRPDFRRPAAGQQRPEALHLRRRITPNHHALAEEFVLLDNYYCNGVVSADGHQWATQGAVSDYREKTSAATPAATTLRHRCPVLCRLQFHLGQRAAGRPFIPQLWRVRLSRTVPAAENGLTSTGTLQTKTGKITFSQSMPMETLQQIHLPNYPGWNLAIPDVVRMDAF